MCIDQQNTSVPQIFEWTLLCCWDRTNNFVHFDSTMDMTLNHFVIHYEHLQMTYFLNVDKQRKQQLSLFTSFIFVFQTWAQLKPEKSCEITTLHKQFYDFTSDFCNKCCYFGFQVSGFKFRVSADIWAILNRWRQSVLKTNLTYHERDERLSCIYNRNSCILQLNVLTVGLNM